MHFDLFGCPCDRKCGGRRGHCPELPVSETQSPESVLGASGDLRVPRDRRRGRAQEPVLITSCLYNPVMASWAQWGRACHFSAHVEALRIVGATALLIGVAEGSEVVRQDEAGVCCIWVQSHRSLKSWCKQKGWFVKHSLYDSTLCAPEAEEITCVLTVINMVQYFLPDVILEVAEMFGHINQ